MKRIIMMIILVIMAAIIAIVANTIATMAMGIIIADTIVPVATE